MSAESPTPDTDRLPVGWQTVAPGYFDAAGMALIRGRDIAATDTAERPHVAILSVSAARELFGTADPIGRRIAVGGGDHDGDWHTVIGVVADVHQVSLTAPPAPRVYDAFGQHWGRTMFVVVRARPGIDVRTMTDQARRIMAAVDPQVPVFEMATLEQLVDKSVAAERLASRLAGALAGVALALAVLGAFTVMAGMAAERGREMAVRIALGASSSRVLVLVLRESALIAVLGCTAGSAGAAASVRWLQHQFFGVTTAEQAVLITGVALALVLATLAAGWWPSRRASRTDPLVVLRDG